MKSKLFNTALAMSLILMFTAPAPAEQTGTPYCGRTDPSKYEAVDYGGGKIYEMLLLDGAMMETDIAYIKRGILPAYTGIGDHRHDNVEEMYVVFNAPAEFTVDGHTSLLPAGSAVLCPLGSTHALYNNSDETIEFLTMAVAKEKGVLDKDIVYGPVPGFGAGDSDEITMKHSGRKNIDLETPAKFRWAQFDRSLTKLVGPAHMGSKLILNRRPWLDGNFETNWVRVGHCILPPGSSIGYHQHTAIEEVYYVMSGEGRSTVNDHTWDTRAGDALPCSLNDSHGLYNNSNEDLDIFVLMVTMEKGKWGTNNWGDDLSGR